MTSFFPPSRIHFQKQEKHIESTSTLSTVGNNKAKSHRCIASAMKSRSDIIAWLSHVDSNPDFPRAEASSVRKRRRDPGQPLSPPESETDKALASKRHTMPKSGRPTPKKRRLEEIRRDGSDEEDDNVEEEQKEMPKASEKSKSFRDARQLFKTPTKQQQRQQQRQPAPVASFSSQSEPQSRTWPSQLLLRKSPPWS